MKAVRYLLIAIVAIVMLAVLAVAIAMAVIDPNDYKPQIEQAVERQTRLDLQLEGDIGWSLLPLGLELNDVNATLEGQRFVALRQLVAQVDLWSLITLSPRVHTFVLDGLEANLEVNAQGEGNWTRIMKPESGAPAAATETTAGTDTPVEETGERRPLDFNVENVEIRDARVHYRDPAAGQSVTLDGFSLTASDITLGSEFPLAIQFQVSTTNPDLTVEGHIDARLAVNEALNDFTASQLQATFDLTGEPFAGKTVRAELSGATQVNLAAETARLSNLKASLADLTLTTDLNIQGFGDNAALNGSLAIQEFSLKNLLSALGQAPIDTRDNDVLNALALSTDIGGAAGKVALNNLTLRLDDTRFQGGGRYTLADGALVFRLQGDRLDADRYLPPEPTATDDTPNTEATATARSAPEDAELLPLETLRSLRLDIDFGLSQLVVSHLTIDDLKASLLARNGVLKLDEFGGKLYQGGFTANATLDARSDTPSWNLASSVTDVQALPLLQDLADMDLLAGGANLELKLNSRGNRLSTLRENADGQVRFNLAQGEFRRMNLTHMACQGIALVNQESLTTTDWGSTTPFNDMNGTLVIKGNTLNNTQLVASLAGMKLEGQGTVDLARSHLDYEAGLRIVGEVHRDPACRVTEYVENVVIPVECRGNFTEDPAGLCSFDGSRFRDTLKTIAANAAKAKAKKELEKARSKAEDKVKEKLEDTLGDKLKGLFQ